LTHGEKKIITVRQRSQIGREMTIKGRLLPQPALLVYFKGEEMAEEKFTDVLERGV
jgi:hypothetical protein